ncbi:hypothetical protein HDV00_000517 [Rhizophlyctis rosea]|nr:hypothetical protein HDV00_000517 [Rhizophlyctis rosea]
MNTNPPPKKPLNPFAVFPDEILIDIFTYIRQHILSDFAFTELFHLLLIDRLFYGFAKKLRPCVAEAQLASTTSMMVYHLHLSREGLVDFYGIEIPTNLWKHPYFNPTQSYFLIYQLTAPDERPDFFTRILARLSYKTSPMRPVEVVGENAVALSCEYCVVDLDDGGEDIKILKKPKVVTVEEGSHESRKFTIARRNGRLNIRGRMTCICSEM